MLPVDRLYVYNHSKIIIYYIVYKIHADANAKVGN